MVARVDDQFPLGIHDYTNTGTGKRGRSKSGSAHTAEEFSPRKRRKSKAHSEEDDHKDDFEKDEQLDKKDEQQDSSRRFGGNGNRNPLEIRCRWCHLGFKTENALRLAKLQDSKVN